MTTLSANPTPYERMELRDGIFYYWKLSRRRGAMALAAPKRCVEVVHRAEHRRIRRRYDAAVFMCSLITLIALFDAAFFPSLPAFQQAAGLVMLVFVFFSANIIRWPLRNGTCQTEIAVVTDRRTLRLIFTRVQGSDPDLETLLDRLQRFEPDEAGNAGKGCVVELAESRGDRLKYLGYAVGSLLLGTGILMNDEDPEHLGYACLLAGGGIVLGLLFSSAINHLFSRVMLAARDALLDGDFDAATLVLNKVLEKKPYHFYSNYLMTANAVVNGDLDAAARHRAAMNGPTGRERLSVIAIDLARTVSSAPAFRKLADYAARREEAEEQALRKVSP